MLNPETLPLGCILGTNPLIEGLFCKPIGHIARPLRRVSVWIVDGYMDLQALLVIRDKRRVSLFSSQTARHFFMTFLSRSRVFVVYQTVTFDHVHIFALRRAKSVDHGVRAQFDTGRIDNQSVPLIVPNGMTHR